MAAAAQKHGWAGWPHAAAGSAPGMLGPGGIGDAAGTEVGCRRGPWCQAKCHLIESLVLLGISCRHLLSVPCSSGARQGSLVAAAASGYEYLMVIPLWVLAAGGKV